MDNTQITPIRLVIAPLGSRLLARIIDVVIVMAVKIGIVDVLIYSSGWGDSSNYLLFVFLNSFLWVYGLIALVYEGGFLTTWGNTVGKWLMGLKVVSERGELISWSQAIIRVVAGIIPMEFIYLLFNSRRQTVHDLLAKTMVIKKH